ncbi:MAG: beta-ketoacyl-[acyl-carrier-protein] synthase family protein [Deltaproteobacteria bacterium]|nr:beta-ketoacyl-[acyl-carrier-protein] synthase family protein [Deltaproteobacteria bacterium]
MSRRVVITGIGMVTPLGVGKTIFSQKLFNGDSGISPITAFDTSRFPSNLGAQVSDFSPADFISRKNLRKMDRLSRMAVASARMAIDDSQINLDSINRDRMGIILGTAYGSTDVSVQFAGTLFDEGPRMVSPSLVPNSVMNAPAGHASIELKFRGINSTVNHHEASGETAIAYAASEIKRGSADVMLTGGTEIISEFFFEILNRFKALSAAHMGIEEAKPFDTERNGFIVGEGSGILCLEDLEQAKIRGATPYCEIVGWGMSAYPSPPTDWPSNPKGPVLAMTRALESARIGPDKIDYICASANGGKKLDRLEAEALSSVFNTKGKQPFISSIKGAVGESFSSGGIRAAATAISIKDKIIPLTLGLKNPIKPLRFILDKNKDAQINFGMVNGFSSGGTFVSIILKTI